ncbi:MAG TPA: glycerol kinase [Hellea balneolensis]|uniref:Glycerol kinase n=1 Tax=Hellea balneolensis TaxID=287478 RepID=A0A7C3C3N1_9PROT|nr:glycerol kinase [Hellea balneolensis]
MSHILAIDQGTTSSRAIVYDEAATPVFTAQQEFPQIYPQDAWVEHDPEAIWDSVLTTTKEALAQDHDIAAIGITNQRETCVVWDRATGAPIYNAIVWQDRRTATVCADMKARGLEDMIAQKTGLLLDPYFSAAKIAWILDHVDGARERADKGELAFGTIDTFLIWRLTQGAAHVTDATNASRTSLYNIGTGEWDDELLAAFNVPRALLPDVHDCASDFGTTSTDVLGAEIPITGVAGDQQAASIGQGCFDVGDIKSTYGTGCFVLLNTGAEQLVSKHRLLTTIAYRLDGVTHYALEGSIFVAGAAVQWLRDEMGLIEHAHETEAMAQGQSSNNGLYLVPAFTGLGAPHWDPNARGAIFGITRATTPADFVRAALESVCYQTHDLLAAMAADGATPNDLNVDGGMAANNWVLQFLSDILDLPVHRPANMETTALGAALLAGSHAGIYQDVRTFHSKVDKSFAPDMSPETRKDLLAGWEKAIGRVLG